MPPDIGFQNLEINFEEELDIHPLPTVGLLDRKGGQIIWQHLNQANPMGTDAFMHPAVYTDTLRTLNYSSNLTMRNNKDKMKIVLMVIKISRTMLKD